MDSRLPLVRKLRGAIPPKAHLGSTLLQSSEQAFFVSARCTWNGFETQYELQCSGNCFPREGFAYCATLAEPIYALLISYRITMLLF